MDRPEPEEYQPRLTAWRTTWRLVGMLAISVLAAGPRVAGQWDTERALFVTDLLLGAVAFVLVSWRRRYPLTIAVVVTALTGVSALAAGPAVLAAVSLATRRRLPAIAVVAAVAVASGQSFATVEPASGDAYWLTLLTNSLFTAAVLGWGMYLGSRRELLWTLHQRAERAEAEQSLRMEQARTTERTRIAREMHDVLAHRISQISMHAGALGFREDLSTEEMRASAEIIQKTAHEALADLRGVLGVLRDTGTGELLQAPQPTFADLPTLVAEAAASGMNVDYIDRLETASSPLPDAVGRTLYRIAQEGITNARKHAPGARLAVEVGGSPGAGIEIELRNERGFERSDLPGSGLGLIGLAERVELRGGRLDHGWDGSSFFLRAWIPWAA